MADQRRKNYFAVNAYILMLCTTSALGFAGVVTCAILFLSGSKTDNNTVVIALCSLIVALVAIVAIKEQSNE